MYNANAYSAEREMSASAFARSMARLTVMASLTSVADQCRTVARMSVKATHRFVETLRVIGPRKTVSLIPRSI